jgi:hypothetical protein
MPLVVTCDCGKSLKVKESLAGKRIRCPECQAFLTVPAAEEEELEPELDEEPAPKKAPAKSPARAAAKAARRPEPEDDEEEDKEEEEERPRGKTKKKKGKAQAEKASPNLLLLLGIGGGALVLAGAVVVVLIVMNSQGGSPKGGTQTANRDAAAKDVAPKDKGKSKGEKDKGKDKIKDNDKQPTPRESISVPAKQFAEEYVADFAAFRDKYANRDITVTGTVAHFALYTLPKGYYSLGLDGCRDKQGFIHSVVCDVRDKEALKKLVGRQTVTVRGKIDFSRGNDTLFGAEIVEFGPDPEPDADLTEEQYLKLLTSDRKGLVNKYLGKAADITGTVGEFYPVKDRGTSVEVLHRRPDGKDGFMFLTILGRDEDRAMDLLCGQRVTIRGRIEGGLNDSGGGLDYCHIVEVGKAPAPAYTAAGLTREYADDRVKWEEKYKRKPLRVEGVVTAIKKTDRGYSLEFAGAAGEKDQALRIVSYIADGGTQQRRDRLAALKVGAAVQLHGMGEIALGGAQIELKYAQVVSGDGKKGP